MTFDAKDLWELLPAADHVPFTELTPDQLARLDRFHAEVREALHEDDRQATCYVLHKGRHLPYIIVNESQKTYEFHNNEILHIMLPNSTANSVDDAFINDLIKAGYTQVLS